MNSIMKNLSQKGTTYLKSKWSIIIFLSGVTFFGIINLFSYGFQINDFSIDSNWFENGIQYGGNYSWLGWLEIIFSTVGSCLTIFSVILTIRFDKRFIIPMAIGESMIIIDAIFMGYVFTAISYALMLLVAFYTWLKWVDDENNESKMTILSWIGVLIFIIIYISCGLVLSSWINSGAPSWNDVISSGIVTACWYIVLRKSKYGYIGFFITDISYMILYFGGGLFATGFSYIVYLFIDSIAFISWYDTN